MSNFVKFNISLLNSPQMVALQQAEGLEGWGIVLLLFKHLVESQNQCVGSLRALPGLARHYGKRMPTINRILTRYGLFVIDAQRDIFYSPYLLRSMKSSPAQALSSLEGDEATTQPQDAKPQPEDTTAQPPHKSPQSAAETTPSATQNHTYRPAGSPLSPSTKAAGKTAVKPKKTSAKPLHNGFINPLTSLQLADNQHQRPAEIEREIEREKEKDDEKAREPVHGPSAPASVADALASLKDKSVPRSSLCPAATGNPPTAQAAAVKTTTATAQAATATAQGDAQAPPDRQWELMRQIYYDRAFLQALEQVSGLAVHENRRLCLDCLYWFHFQCRAKGKHLASLGDAKRYLTALLTRGRNTRADFMVWLNKKREREVQNKSFP